MAVQATERQQRFALRMMLVYALTILAGILLVVLISKAFHFSPAFWHFHITRPPAPQG